MNKKDNIFYFFLLALLIHLSLFLVNQKGVKGDAPVSLKTNSAPISVKIKSRPITKKETVIPKEKSSLVPPKEEKKPEPKKIETPKKEIVKPDVKSKIKDTKKKIEKRENRVEKKQVEKPQPIKKTKENSSLKQDINSNDKIELGGNFNIGKDGVLIASSSDGIEYKILKQVEPNYPIQAEKIRYRKKVIVSARFLVGLKGEIEKIEIIQSHKKFGFDDEVKKALQQWRFHPIYYKNKNTKVYFTKEFIFERH